VAIRTIHLNSLWISWKRLTCAVVIVVVLAIGGCQVNPSPSVHTNITHLTLWHGVNPPPNRDVLQILVDRFNQTHPEIQVESLYVGQSDQQMPKLFAAIAGNAAPDLLWYGAVITGQLWELDALQPLDAWLNQSAIKDEIDPALYSSMQWSGQTWSLPFGTNNVGLFYRPSLFKAAGITELPKTWDGLRHVARKLTTDTNGDGTIDQHGMMLPLGRGEWTVFTWLPFMWSGGGNLTVASSEISRDSSKQEPSGSLIYGNNVISGRVVPSTSGSVPILNAGAIAALQLWQDLVQDGSAILSQPERGYELDAFLAGKVAMQLTGPWTLGELAAKKAEFGVMPIPVGQTPATVVGGENLFMFKTTDAAKAKAAWTFMEYLVSEPSQTLWATKTGYLPVNLKSRRSPDYQAFIQQQPAVQVFLEQAQHGRSRPITPGYTRISENLGRAIETVLMNQATPEEALKTYQTRLDLALSR
jgi:multiple sugar transport system substrate-binding protein